jgi:hypothetical protein
MTVYRCVDGKGVVSLQDVPCTDASKQEIRKITRPIDAPPPKTSTSQAAPAPPTSIVIGPPINEFSPSRPAPDLFRCTDFDGKVREAEYYDPKPRCVPLWVLGYQTNSNACRWIEDSCVRYEGSELCERWKDKQRKTELDLRHASSSDSPYLKSELARFTQIVNTSCR